MARSLFLFLYDNMTPLPINLVFRSKTDGLFSCFSFDFLLVFWFFVHQLFGFPEWNIVVFLIQVAIGYHYTSFSYLAEL